MCGIMGSARESMFEVMYEANKARGNFGSGLIILGETANLIIRKDDYFDFDAIGFTMPKLEYMIGHIQAPTSSNRKWTSHTAHPFETQDWCIVHNGVLTNDKALKEVHIPNDRNPVDSSVIVNLLQLYTGKGSVNTDNTKHYCLCLEQQVDIIRRVLEKLEGTFALCMVYKPTSEVYIARQGSVLHMSETGDFSTVKGKQMEEVEEGMIYNFKMNQWIPVSTFKTTSPFLFV